MYKNLALLALLLAVVSCATSMEDDYVEHMPGWGDYNFKVYSGMLDADSNGSRQLHYVFLESQSSPVDDDMVIWLNGGPGCSSMLGLIQENGPFMFQGINEEFTDMQQYSWNKEANVIYIESPAGVGFSVNNDEDYEYTDDHTAEDMMYAYDQFLQRFAESKIEIQGKKTWISGESYGGMYIPFFANAILDYNEDKSNTPINLAGFLIGNGAWILDWNFLGLFQINAYPQHQFFNPELTSNWYDGCLGGQEEECENFLESINNVGNNTDVYNIYNYTYTYSNRPENNNIYRQGDMLSKKSMDQFSEKSESKKDFMTKEFINKNFINTEKYTGKKQEKQQNESSVPTPEDIFTAYFNLDEVKEALHVDPSIEWESCNMEINRNYHSAPNSTHLYPRFFDEGLQILIFSGNTDAAVPFPYTWYCMNDLMENYDVDMTVTDKWRQWGPMADQQMGGMVQTWQASKTSDSQFTFAMVRAAGHEVPMYQPLAAFNMFYNFTHGIPI